MENVMNYEPFPAKKITISPKRQMTIPQKFYKALRFEGEAECLVRGDELVIRPVHDKSGGEFAEQILTSLVRKGYSGEELIEHFRTEQAKIRPAVEAMIEDAEKAAKGEGICYDFDEVFNKGK